MIAEEMLPSQQLIVFNKLHDIIDMLLNDNDEDTIWDLDHSQVAEYQLSSILLHKLGFQSKSDSVIELNNFNNNEMNKSDISFYNSLRDDDIIHAAKQALFEWQKSYDIIHECNIELKTKENSNECSLECNCNINQCKTFIFIRNGPTRTRSHNLGIFEAAKVRQLSNCLVSSSLFPINEEDIKLSENEYFRKLINPSNKTLILSSDAERAISNLIIALWSRLGVAGNKEYIHLLKSLDTFKHKKFKFEYQGLNVDPTFEQITQFYQQRLIENEESQWIQWINHLKVDGFIRRECDENIFIPMDIIDIIYQYFHIGFNHGLLSNLMDRFKLFCDWTFDKYDKDTFIICGFWQWIQEFFKIFSNGNNEICSKKLKHCAIIGFQVNSYNDKHQTQYKIVESSISTLYSGVRSRMIL